MDAKVSLLIAETCEFLGGGEVVGGVDGINPRFLLFNAPNSICSHKVRTVLAFHKIAYNSCTMNIAAGDTYFPAYVRLRLHACDYDGLPLVSGHDGSTSVSSQGCDPAVVPTLVDWETGQVVIDSRKICIYLDALMPEEMSLYPQQLQPEIDAQLNSIDDLPNYQLMIGGLARAGAKMGRAVAQEGAGFAMAKVTRCQNYMVRYAHEADLMRAYGAKQLKELKAAEVLFSDKDMEKARNLAQSLCARLDNLLGRDGNNWLLGNDLTMADLWWAIQLIRFKSVGLAIWEGGSRPHIDRFFKTAIGLGAIRLAILQWPDAL